VRSKHHSRPATPTTSAGRLRTTFERPIKRQLAFQGYSSPECSEHSSTYGDCPWDILGQILKSINTIAIIWIVLVGSLFAGLIIMLANEELLGKLEIINYVYIMISQEGYMLLLIIMELQKKRWIDKRYYNVIL